MPRVLAAILVTCIISVVSACGGKVESPMSPTASVGSCQLTLDPASQTAPSSGGSFYTAVSGPCSWTAASDDNWISITYGQGSGVGSVTYTVLENPASTPREGHVRIGGQVLVVRQSAPECRFSVQPASLSVPAGGGAVEFRIDTDAACAWSAASSEPWLSLRSSNGSGPQVASAVAAENTGASERSATIRIADQTVSVQQSGRLESPPPPTPPTPTCSFSLSQTSLSVGIAGGSFQTDVNASAGCSWTATTSEGWISLSTRSGSGSGSVSFSVASNSGSQRKGTVQVAGQVLTVTQAGCSYTVSPASQSVPDKGGDFAFSVMTADSCAWSASTGTSWIAIVSGSGKGPGRGVYNVRPNDGAARSGKIGIADQSIAVAQDAIVRIGSLPALK